MTVRHEDGSEQVVRLSAAERWALAAVGTLVMSGIGWVVWNQIDMRERVVRIETRLDYIDRKTP